MRASALVKSDSKKVLAVSLVLAVMMLDLAAPAFAEQRGGGPGGGGFKRGNPPGPQGGPGAGPRYGNNPPGQAGGPGTNWGNPPGPQGGPGAGPRYGNNPPGQAGGPGTNWGNPPGPQGGPGTGPNVVGQDTTYVSNNPPGQAGGPGTNWGNPPGPQGGPGAGPQWQQFKQQMIQRRVDKLTAFREKMVAQGAPADKLAKIDRRIQMLQAKTQPEQQAVQETVAAETAPAETQASQ